MVTANDQAQLLLTQILHGIENYIIKAKVSYISRLFADGVAEYYSPEAIKHATQLKARMSTYLSEFNSTPNEARKRDIQIKLNEFVTNILNDRGKLSEEIAISILGLKTKEQLRHYQKDSINSIENAALQRLRK